jgi:hypothetical protein
LRVLEKIIQRRIEPSLLTECADGEEDAVTNGFPKVSVQNNEYLIHLLLARALRISDQQSLADMGREA